MKLILTLLSAESILAVRHHQSTSQHYTAEKSFFMEVGIITDAELGWAGLGWLTTGAVFEGVVINFSFHY